MLLTKQMIEEMYDNLLKGLCESIALDEHITNDDEATEVFHQYRKEINIFHEGVDTYLFYTTEYEQIPFIELLEIRHIAIDALYEYCHNQR